MPLPYGALQQDLPRKDTEQEAERVRLECVLGGVLTHVPESLSHELSRPAVPGDVSRDIRDMLQPLLNRLAEAEREAAEQRAQVRLLEERAESSRRAEDELQRVEELASGNGGRGWRRPAGGSDAGYCERRAPPPEMERTIL